MTEHGLASIDDISDSDFASQWVAMVLEEVMPEHTLLPRGVLTDLARALNTVRARYARILAEQNRLSGCPGCGESRPVVDRLCRACYDAQRVSVRVVCPLCGGAKCRQARVCGACRKKAGHVGYAVSGRDDRPKRRRKETCNV